MEKMNYLKKLSTKLLKCVGNAPELTLENQPCYDRYGRFLGWFSRSMATAIFVFCKDADGDWCVLASERGEEAADFRGMWNCPCGYLDFDETTKECAVRECFEETGVKLPIESLISIGYEDDPVKANRQNVTFRFAAKIEDRITSDFEFSKEHNEGKEVGKIAWVKVKDIDNYEWAFNHKNRIVEIFNQIIK
jgi:8-oxo-dGTP pyrophosphatase MutT (NUDIX family)